MPLSLVFFIGVKNTKKDCWKKCRKSNGACSWCGPRGACCKKGGAWAYGGCDGKLGGDKRHECVPRTVWG